MAEATMLRALRGHQVLGVARQMGAAALPRGTEELLADGIHQLGVVVGGHELHAGKTEKTSSLVSDRPQPAG